MKKKLSKKSEKFEKKMIYFYFLKVLKVQSGSEVMSGRVLMEILPSFRTETVEGRDDVTKSKGHKSKMSIANKHANILKFS